MLCAARFPVSESPVSRSSLHLCCSSSPARVDRGTAPCMLAVGHCLHVSTITESVSVLRCGENTHVTL